MSLSVFGLIARTHARVLESDHKLIFPLSVVLDKSHMNVNKVVDKMTQGSCIPTDLVKSGDDDYSSLIHNIGIGAFVDSDKTNLACFVG